MKEVINVIFDLDGTLADCEGRRHHVTGKKKNWKAFFSECDQDTVIVPVANLLRRYREDSNYKVWILSGRMGDVDTRAKTYKWLADNNLSPCGSNFMCDIAEHFMMRKDGDFRSDMEVKREMIDSLGLTPDNTEVCFDDRDCMVKAYRDWGFTVFQVAPGNF